MELNITKYNARGVTHPDILYFPKGLNGYKYWLYYTPYPPNEEENPCLVRSNDVLAFMPVEVLIPELDWEGINIGHPDVIFNNGLYEIHYIGSKQMPIYNLGIAISNSGLYWTKQEVVLLGDSYHPYRTSCIYINDRKILYYGYIAKYEYKIGRILEKFCIEKCGFKPDAILCGKPLGVLVDDLSVNPTNTELIDGVNAMVNRINDRYGEAKKQGKPLLVKETPESKSWKSIEAIKIKRTYH